MIAAGERPGLAGVLDQDADAVLLGASCPARILSRGSLEDAVHRLPAEPGLHSVSNAALRRIDVDLDARLAQASCLPAGSPRH